MQPCGGADRDLEIERAPKARIQKPTRPLPLVCVVREVCGLNLGRPTGGGSPFVLFVFFVFFVVPQNAGGTPRCGRDANSEAPQRSLRLGHGLHERAQRLEHLLFGAAAGALSAIGCLHRVDELAHSVAGIEHGEALHVRGPRQIGLA
jgi:hypothetical protein